MSLERGPEGSDPPSAAGLDDLCAPFLTALPIDGLSISVFARGAAPSTVCVSDATAARLDELHFELGEGPFWDVIRTGQAVSVADFSQTGGSRWPVLASAMRPLDFRGLFAFPMNVGATTVGVVGMHRKLAGELTALETTRAVSLARLTTARAVRMAIDRAQAESLPSEVAVPEMRRQVLQATGMVLAQLGVTATEGFARLRAYAFATGRSVEDVAADVVARRVDFRDLEMM
jgi:hypothetical protein